MPIKQIADTQKQLDALSRNPMHFSGATYTRSTTLALTAASQVILSFDTTVRESGITKDGTNSIFTINSAGLYMIAVNYALTSNTETSILPYVNGASNVTKFANSYAPTFGSTASACGMLYLNKNDQLRISIYSSGNTTLTVVGENSAGGMSPYLYIAQISPKFT